MRVSVELIIFIMATLFIIIVILSGQIIVNKLSTIEENYQRNYKRLATILSLISNAFEGTVQSLREVKDIKQCLVIDELEGQLKSKTFRRLERQEIRYLRSPFKTRRKEAVTYLGLIESKEARLAIEKGLETEKDYAVKIYMVNSLADMNHPDSVMPIVQSLVGTHKWYREKAISSLLDFGSALMNHYDELSQSRKIEIIELLIRFAAVNINQDLKTYVNDIIDRYDQFLEEVREGLKADVSGTNRYKLNYLEADFELLLEDACAVMADYYYMDFSEPQYYNDHRPVVRRHAYLALAKRRTTFAFNTLLERIDDHDAGDSAITAINRMTEDNPRFLYLVEEAFESAKDDETRESLAQVLSNRIEYYILRLATDKHSRAEKVLKEILSNEKVSELIGFLNRNKDIELENQIVEILKTILTPESSVELEMRTYLSARILEKCGLTPEVIKSERHQGAKDSNLVRVVAGFTLGAIIIFPIIYVLRHDVLVQKASLWINIRQYVIDFNYYLAYYSATINLSYMILLVLAFFNLKKQSTLWNMKNISMLFRKSMIPSISIIAPAFNEEKTITASVNSLLNLKYPDYEVIIVNDGSTDETLHTLINTFDLIRVDHDYKTQLNTAPIRGIYKNASLPKLIVVDKGNGGKADSLNAGINISTNEYFCGIDADSLLESEALLKVASLTLDESVETPALGGNIFPINGCVVDRGHISDIGIPKSHLGRLETMEYIRAFMAGRLGWEYFNSLLIISGAFGLFRKERIISIGGYLTSKGRYKKDTVGEDMELVVRIAKMMYEAKQPFKIGYAFNANCWTEIPEDLKSLRTQRYRWHRGLIDILFFHRRMMFNPRYGRIGLVAFPYFLIFEAIGPMIEIQGYIMVILAAILGILDGKIAIMLFVTTILLGVMTSLTALLIAEKDSDYFTMKDLFRLIGYAVVENFGPRQLISFWRVLGQFKVIFGSQGWGTIKRKGI